MTPQEETTMPTVPITRRPAAAILHDQAADLLEASQRHGWEQETRRRVAAAAITIEAVADRLDRDEWSEEESELLQAAIANYKNKQEHNRESAERRFGNEAGVYKVTQKIATLERMLDRARAAHKRRWPDRRDGNG